MFRTISFGVFALALPSQLNAEMIHLFARQGNVDKVMAEIAKGVDPDLPSTRNTTEVGVSPLFIAAKFGKVAVVQALVDQGAKVNTFFDHASAMFPYGTALHVASSWGQTDVVSALLAAGADPNAFHPEIGTPLQAALETGKTAIGDMLIAAGATTRVEPAPIDALIRDADLTRGKELSGICEGCHELAEAKEDFVYPGPPLWDIVGREIGAADFEYSDVMAAEEGTWTYQALNGFLASPFLYMPGAKMYKAGLKNDADRAAIIGYLRTLADDPVPLP